MTGDSADGDSNDHVLAASRRRSPAASCCARCQRLRPARAIRALLADRAHGEGEAKRAAQGIAHFKPKAKNVIFCFMDGGVSHVDTFDPKPKLAEQDGKTSAGRNPTADGNANG